jgi:deoxyribonuclease IV
MKYIGAHVSISGGLAEAPPRATEIGANALGIFTKNQRQWKSKPLTDEEISAFTNALEQANIRPEHVIVHDSYLINIGNPDEGKRTKSLDALLDEVRRVEQLGLVYLNFHPGSGMREITEDETNDLIAQGVNQVLAESENAVLLLESTAGQGAHVGYRFEHLADIMEKVEKSDRIGVCVDTCHMFAAGYDIRTAEAFAATFQEFDRVVGFDKLKGMHINDAKVDFESRKDRHDSLGEGTIGWDAFRFLMEDSRFDDVAMVLETPVVDTWKDEIAKLFEFAGQK